MYATGNKKMLNMLILEILKKYSDEDHSLTQQEIIKQLNRNYGMECDRRSVKNNILSLKEMGYDISTDKGYRLLSRDFDDSELRILIDSILFSKAISKKQARYLIEKIRGMGSNYFNIKVSHVCNLPELSRTLNKQAMYSVGAINDAIVEKRKIEFIYNEVGTDFKLHPKREAPYKVNPYQIVANNGRFYLIANYDKYDNIAHFRIDKMTEVKILEEKIKPLNRIPGFEKGLNLPKHMAEHLYMFSGTSVNAELKISPTMMSEMVDWFGTDFSIVKKSPECLVIRVLCNFSALEYWALQYGPYVEVLKPEALREQIRTDVNKMYSVYNS
ncbi:helix-turn-helix transcriptional regulator [Butyrivibrio sp. VCD2006]|uniref:helix-turn-helix transcriptional regulator n=1 Tax=Butyrivibrio sp. VCD2006 TaxID=1280664 RepID=UPI00040D1A82|nr:WYL domain-containing protein [Butyrivibrio sp. VCD2006]